MKEASGSRIAALALLLTVPGTINHGEVNESTQAPIEEFTRDSIPLLDEEAGLACQTSVVPELLHCQTITPGPLSVDFITNLNFDPYDKAISFMIGAPKIKSQFTIFGKEFHFDTELQKVEIGTYNQNGTINSQEIQTRGFDTPTYAIEFFETDAVPDVVIGKNGENNPIGFLEVRKAIDIFQRNQELQQKEESEVHNFVPANLFILGSE